MLKYLVAFLCFAAVGMDSALAAPPDVLVVCPAEFREALLPWIEFRKGQGHEISVIDPPQSAADLKAGIAKATTEGRLQYLLLVGDVPIGSTPASARRLTIPTNYIPAKINVRWGSEKTIASDTPYGDVDGDGSPELAVGRIPADSPEQLAATVRKLLRYEQNPQSQPWDRQLTALAGAGDFGALADSLIEAAGQQIMAKALPPGYVVSLARAKTGTAVFGPLGPSINRSAAPLPKEAQPAEHRPAIDQLQDGCLLWVYLGHAMPTELDYVKGANGPESLLTVDDVPKLRCGGHCPLAMFVSCYTGACDASRDCLAEELLLSEEGPVSVVAATRVSMPYGNTIFCYEFLRASLVDRPATLGAAIRLAQRRTLAASDGDVMRKSLETMALGLGPVLHRGKEPWRPDDLVDERREHVALYQLLGDPLLRWRRPLPMAVRAPADAAAGQPLAIECQAEFNGDCLVELTKVGATSGPVTAGNDEVQMSKTEALRSGKLRVSLNLPADASGNWSVRAYLRGEKESAVGGANIVVRPKE